MMGGARVKPKYVVAGVLAATLALAGGAQARVGSTVSAFDQTELVKKLGYKRTGSQGIVVGHYKGFTAHQYVSPDTRSFIDLVVSPKGTIVEQAMLLPLHPNALDAARFVSFMQEATNNSVDMNDVFKFIAATVQAGKDASKQFGGYILRAYSYAGVVLDLKVTATSPPAAPKQGATP
jgi:hypothetical protein